MDAERWRRMEELYHAAQVRPPEARAEFLAEACADDAVLRKELASLLAHSGSLGTFLERPAIEMALGRDESSSNSRAPWWIYAIAAAFLARAVFITYFCFFGPESMGIDVRPTETSPAVSKVAPDSPAQRAGIRPGDVLARADGQVVRDINYWYWFFTKVEPGRPFVLETERSGQDLRAVLQLKRRPAQYWSTGQGMVLLLNLCGQFLALAVACFLMFFRPEHALARMGALFLAVYSTAVFFPFDGFNWMWRHWPVWYQAVLWFTNVINSIGLGIWFTFFALFPRPSFHKTWIWIAAWVPMFVLALIYNYQVWHYIYSPENMIPSAWISVIVSAYWTAYLLGSFAMLAVKYWRLPEETERRRVRLFVIALALVVVLAVPVLVYSQPEYANSPGAWLFLSVPMRALATLAGVAFPLCFAYAILRHRLFDIRVIIRQGIRYAAAKQLLLLAVPAIIVVFAADLYTHRNRRVDEIVQDRGWMYVSLAGLAALAHVRRNRWLLSLDRHFFREQYNAQDILHSTLDQVRAARSLGDVAPKVVKQIHAAMHPTFCAVLERRPMDTAYSAISIFPDRFSLPILRSQSKIVELAKLVDKPVQLSMQDGWLNRELPEHSSAIDLLAPVRNSGLDAFLALGKKRSEEPYTSDDLRLIEDLAIGLALLPSAPPHGQPADVSSKECSVCGQCYDMAGEFCRGDGTRLTTNSFPRCLLGRFRLEFRIGRGGMGLVYEATDLQLQRKVAVKLILEDLIRDPAALDRFRREAHLLANFQHANAVTLFDVGVMPSGRPFLVMERLTGRTLREELKGRTRLPAVEVRSILRQLCAALSAAHRRSLIHRDLKPENIFLCEDDRQHLVKILDFGLAKLVMETSHAAPNTRFSTMAGQIAGTPAYMPPELLLGAKPEPGCDLWALAVITFEMLMGHRSLLARNEELAGSWRDFFDWALAHEPDQRPQSADAFLERFEQCVQDG